MKAAVVSHPDLAWLWMFDGNGYIREACIKVLATPPQSAFECAAIAYRMNDWVPQVRKAARIYAAEYIPQTEASVIVSTAEFLLTRLDSAQRWDAETRSILENRIYDPSVREALINHLISARTGRTARLLRQLLRRDELDPALANLAVRAKLPLVRAIAAQALISGKIRWVDGSRRQWIDKTMGQYRTVPAMAERPILRPENSTEVIWAASKDRSPVVRRSVAFGLTEIWRTAAKAEDDIAASLALDRSPGVQFYAEFYLRKRREAGLLKQDGQTITSAQSL